MDAETSPAAKPGRHSPRVDEERDFAAVAGGCSDNKTDNMTTTTRMMMGMMRTVATATSQGLRQLRLTRPPTALVLGRSYVPAGTMPAVE